MAEEIVKTIENVDKLFSEIVVNGEVHKSNRYVSPSAQSASPSSVRSTQGEDVHAVELNDVLHNFSDPDVFSDVQALQQGLTNETNARYNADQNLQGQIDTVGGNVSTLQGKVNTIESEIPPQASSQNQLADKNFVNSSIATNTANFLGTYTSMADIEAIPNPTNNDYVFLQTTDSAGNNVFSRYKYNAEQDEWLYEYELNNSSFTAEQWATINSGLTQSSVTQEIEDAIAEYVYVNKLPTDAVLHYSFDEVPDYPDGTAIEKHLKDFTSIPDGWSSNNRGVLSVANGELVNTITNGTNPYIRRYYSSQSSGIVKVKVRATIDCFISINYYNGSVYTTLASVANAKAGQEYILTAFVPIIDFILVQAIAPTATDFQLILSEYYLGNGSYATPVIDNANGQWNSVSQSGVAVQGVSGKGLKGFVGSSCAKISNFNFTDDFTVSLWVNPANNTPNLDGDILFKTECFVIRNGFNNGSNMLMFVWWNTSTSSYVVKDLMNTLLPANEWQHLVLIKSGTSIKLYINTILKTTQTLANSSIGKNDSDLILHRGTSYTRETSYDDLLIFNRALSETEVTALYFNKANTPKYFPQPTDKIEQNNWGLATSGGVYKAFGGFKTYEVVMPDFKNTLLIADITDWYNSTSSETTQLVYFAGLMTAYRGGSPVCYTGTIQLYVSNYRSGQRINDVRSSVRMNGVSNRDITFEAEVVEYNNRQYLAIKRSSDQAVTLRFLVSTSSDFEPLFTGLDRRTETITEIFKDTSYPIAPRESGTYNLQCAVSATGVPTYQWVAV